MRTVTELNGTETPFPVNGRPYGLSVFSKSAGRGGSTVDMLAAGGALVLGFYFCMVHLFLKDTAAVSVCVSSQGFYDDHNF